MHLQRPALALYLAIAQARPTLADAPGTPGLALKDTEALLAEARQPYDYVVLDRPPFVPFPDCRLIAKSVDGFVLVVASNRTLRGVLAEALTAMDPEKAVRYVFNAHPARPTAHYEDANGHGRALPRRRKGETS